MRSRTHFYWKALENLAFALFLFSLFFSVRKVLAIFPPLQGSLGFNEYTDISLYFSDIALFFFLLILIIRNKLYNLSSYEWNKVFHVEHLLRVLLLPALFLLWASMTIFWSENQLLSINALFRLFEGIFLYGVLILLSVPRGTQKDVNGYFPKDTGKDSSLFHVEHIEISTQVSEERWFFKKRSKVKDIFTGLVKMFHVERLLMKLFDRVPRGTQERETVSYEKIVEYSEINMFHVEHRADDPYESVPRGTLDRLISFCSTWNIYQVFFLSFITFSFIQAFFGIFQFYLQHSIGLPLYLESFISKDIPGVAKFHIPGDTLIRAYGLFPHPNIFGSYLALALVFLVFYPLVFHKRFIRMFHVEQKAIGNVPRGTSEDHLNVKMFHVEQILYRIGVVLLTLGLFVSFSKSAWVALGLSFIIILFHVEHLSTSLVPRGTFKTLLKVFHVEHKNILSILVAGFALFTVLKIIPLKQSIEERFFYLQSFTYLKVTDFIFGLGAGQFVFHMQTLFSQPLLSWQFQPVHSVFLMILLELGLVGLILFLLFINNLWKFFLNVPRGTIKFLGLSTLIFFLTSFLFDHFFWDIQQGNLLFWCVLGVLISLALKQSFQSTEVLTK